MIRPCLLAASLLMSLGACAQDAPVQEAPMSMRSLEFQVSSLGGYAVRGVAHGIEGLDYSAGASVTTPGDEIVLHRVILDRTHHVYFGYDLELFPASLPGKLRVHFQPLSDLRGFGFDQAAFHAAEMALPADGQVDLGMPLVVPLERDKDQTVLRDTLTFTPAP